MKVFNVYLNGEMIDIVFYGKSSKVDADEVKQSLVVHDGYDSRIVVKRARELEPVKLEPNDQV